jgi:RimJ/RimL family protein N-acetyltransferase
VTRGIGFLERSISFRQLRESDLAQLHEWLQRHHVAQWWQPSNSLAENIEHYRPRTQPDALVQGFFAFIDDAPIGFIQSYVVKDAGDGWWEAERDPGARGIDQFLANEAQLNCGLGTLMVRAFVARLFEDVRVTQVQTDPSPENLRAIRCYEKAGFVSEGEVQTPDGRAMLMRLTRAQFTSKSK